MKAAGAYLALALALCWPAWVTNGAMIGGGEQPDWTGTLWAWWCWLLLSSTLSTTTLYCSHSSAVRFRCAWRGLGLPLNVTLLSRMMNLRVTGACSASRVRIIETSSLIMKMSIRGKKPEACCSLMLGADGLDQQYPKKLT